LFPDQTNSEDAKMRSEAEKIWNAGKQERPRLLPVFLPSKFIATASIAASRLRR
jgi:hypothetical protein